MLFSCVCILSHIYQDLARDLHFEGCMNNCKSRSPSGLKVCMVIEIVARIRRNLVRDLHLEGVLKSEQSISNSSLHIGDLQHYGFQLCLDIVTYLSRSRS